MNPDILRIIPDRVAKPFGPGPMRKNPAVHLLLFSMLTVAHPAIAATFYVDNQGNDANDGLNLKAPFRTLPKAVSAVKPGDAIELRAGHYTGTLISRPGRADAWISLRAYNNEKAVITAEHGGSPTLYFYHSSCDESNPNNHPCQALYWNVEGLEIQGSGRGGGDDNVIKVDTPKIRIVGNNLHGSSADIIKLVNTADDVEILRNEIHHPNARAGANAQGVDIVGADRTHVAHNHVHDIPSIGMYAKGNSRNTVFENNLVERTWSHGIMLGQSTDADRLRDGRYETYDGIIRNNIIRQTGWSCVATASSFNVHILNNSCYDTGSDTHGSVLISNESEVKQAGTNIELRNNIFFGSARQPLIKITSNAMTDTATLHIDHNLYWTTEGAATVRFTWRDKGLERVSFDNWRKATRHDAHSLIADPRFSDLNTLIPAPNSPALNAGTDTLLVTHDYAGSARPCRGKIDIGAHEYCTSTP